MQAETVYKQILEQRPECADAWNLLGVIAHQCNQSPLAVELMQQAIQLDAGQANFHFNLAVALQSADNLPQAAHHYRATLKLQPEHSGALENLGVLEIDQGNLQAARQLLETALRHAPDSLLAWLNLGTLYNRMQHPQRALECFDAAVEHHPDNADAHLKRGCQLLSQGILDAGWEEYVWRWSSAEFLQQNQPRQFPYPRWDGSLKPHQRLLVIAEQGLGDEVMFATCLPDLLEHVARITLACDVRLHPLFARSFPGLQLQQLATIDHPETLAQIGEFDAWLYLADLPRKFRRDWGQFSQPRQLLQADPSQVNHWRNKLRCAGGNQLIGISWQGGRESRGQQARSLPLAHWQELLKRPHTTFVSLQYGDHRRQISEINRLLQQPLLDFDEIDPLRELDEFAALITALDLVITVDNSTAHLAGALDTQTWVLLPQPADWRWFQQHDTTPWYPSLRLFRQPDPSPRSWTGLLRQVSKALKQT